MEDEYQDIESLKAELDEYRKEKEQIRHIIGAIGGAIEGRGEKTLNFCFIALICAVFAIDMLRHFGHVEIEFLSGMLSLEIGVLLVSVKIIWMIHKQSKVEHFQFWILNSIEFRLNAVSKKLSDIEKKLGVDADSSEEEA